jgi:hypothetical protein
MALEHLLPKYSYHFNNNIFIYSQRASEKPLGYPLYFDQQFFKHSISHLH